MEERTIDLKGMPERVGELAKVVRQSEVFPAILGAVAGGVAGALIATVIANRAGSRSRASAIEVDAHGDGKKWSLREVVQLATVAAAVLRQLQGWYEQRRGEQSEYA